MSIFVTDESQVLDMLHLDVVFLRTHLKAIIADM